MHRIRLLTLLTAFLGVIGTAVSEAAEFIWRLDDVVFENGGTATGYLVYDGESGTVTDWAIQVEGGSGGFPPFTYERTDSFVAVATDKYVRLTEINSIRILQIIATAPLRTATGRLPLSPDTSEVLSEARRAIVSGSLVRNSTTP